MINFTFETESGITEIFADTVEDAVEAVDARFNAVLDFTDPIPGDPNDDGEETLEVIVSDANSGDVLGMLSWVAAS